MAVLALGLCVSCQRPSGPAESDEDEQRPILVGVLHSLTGTMAISEKSVVDATLLAIEEINAEGGLLGRKIEPVVVDGRSDWPTFASEAERLISQEKVSAVFGCWTSASRKTVRPIFEKHGHLLFYPVQYEGLEQSPHIVYTGATPNQQILPAVRWCFENIGKKFFLVGSDYVFPRTANAIIRDQLRSLHGEVVGEEYLLLGSSEVQDAVQKIVVAEPDVILNTINGDSNVAFFRELRAAGITPEKIPTMSFSIAEDELRMLGLETMVGDYASWNYFQSITSEENTQFVRRFQEKYGRQRVTDDPMEAAYVAVHLWARAVREAGTDDVGEVREAVANRRFRAPEGTVYVDPRNNHLWKTARIGRVTAEGQFAIVWTSEKPIRPDPYPGYRSASQWLEFLDALYRGWGESWANPGP
jgi:urea transport system substrate-binding protein